MLSSGQIKMLACLRVSLALSWSLVDFSDDIAELVGYACVGLFRESGKLGSQ